MERDGAANEAYTSPTSGHGAAPLCSVVVPLGVPCLLQSFAFFFFGEKKTGKKEGKKDYPPDAAIRSASDRLELGKVVRVHPLGSCVRIKERIPVVEFYD